MNDELKKKSFDRKKNMMKYMERHQTLCVTLDNKNDADIIDWLGRHGNRSQAVRKALREIIREEKSKSKATISDGTKKTGRSKKKNKIEVSEG